MLIDDAAVAGKELLANAGPMTVDGDEDVAGATRCSCCVYRCGCCGCGCARGLLLPAATLDELDDEVVAGRLFRCGLGRAEEAAAAAAAGE